MVPFATGASWSRICTFGRLQAVKNTVIVHLRTLRAGLERDHRCWRMSSISGLDKFRSFAGLVGLFASQVWLGWLSIRARMGVNFNLVSWNRYEECRWADPEKDEGCR
jgi:hypothetical protein